MRCFVHLLLIALLILNNAVFSQSLEDLLSSYTDVINLNRGGNVPNGTNLAIDKFLSSMM